MHNTTGETGAPERMFRLPEERWRRLGFHWRREEEHGGSSGLDSAILTFDPSICYTLHQENQPTTKEEGKQPKHSRSAKYKLHRGPFLPPGRWMRSPADPLFSADYLWGGKQAFRGLQFTALLISSRDNYTAVRACLARHHTPAINTVHLS